MNRILVVDDLESNQQLLRQMLVRSGYEVEMVFDGQSAVEILPRFHPDLILLDIMMPYINGFDTCRSIKAIPAYNDIPIIFISAVGDMEDKVRAFEVGGVDYITRPFQKAEVIARIQTHLILAQQKRQLQAQAEQDRLYFEKIHQTKNAFIRGVSYDIKNPIGAVIAFAELLKSNPKVQEDPILSRQVERIERASRASLNLVLNVLDLVRIEAGKPLELVQVALHQLLRDVFQETQFLADTKELYYQMRLPDETIILMVDWDQMKRALTNLLTNTIKFTDLGDSVELVAESLGDHIKISVISTGDGLPEEILPHIFEEFYPLDSEVHEDSTGLELSLVRAIVHQHGGQVEVENQVDVGTTFYILLPLVGGET